MEDFQIPENLSRFAVRHGMWGFVQKMVPACNAFIAERRGAGIAPDAQDPNAFGADGATAAAAHSPILPPAAAAAGKPVVVRHVHSASDLQARTEIGNLKRVASAVVAGSMLIALGGLGRQQQLETAERRRRLKAERRARVTQ